MTLLVGVDLTTSTAIDPVADAREAERLGFDFVSASDHPAGTTPSYETWTLLAWVAASTTRISVLTRVLSVPMRNPGLVAKMAASLDQLSDGRLLLGLGGGHGDGELHAFGLPVPTPREKVDGLADAVTIVRRLWTERTVTYEGRVHRTEAADIEPKPARPIPVWLGTFGERALRVTGRLADGWIPTLAYAGVDRLPAMRERVLAAAADSGRDPESVTCALNLGVHIGRSGDDSGTVTGDPSTIARRLAELAATGFTAFNLQVRERSQWERLAADVLPTLRAGT